MKKRTLCLILALVMIFALVASGCGKTAAPAAPAAEPAAPAAPAEEPAAPAEEPAAEEPAAELDLPAVTLNYSSPFPSTHNFSIIDEYWYGLLQDQANITLTPFYTNTLVSGATPYQETVAGVSDITFFSPGSEQDHFLVENCLNFFWHGTTNGEALYNTVWDFYESTPEWKGEYDGVELLSVTNSYIIYVLSVKPINSLDDMVGKTFRCSNNFNWSICEALGGYPVRMPISECVEALSKGTIDGVILPAEALQSTGLASECKYAMNLKLMDAFNPQKYINAGSYADKLTADQQQLLKDLTRERDIYQIEQCAVWETNGIEFAKGEGVTFGEFTAEEYARLDTLCEELAQRDVQKLNDLGHDGEAMYQHARELLETNLAKFGG